MPAHFISTIVIAILYVFENTVEGKLAVSYRNNSCTSDLTWKVVYLQKIDVKRFYASFERKFFELDCEAKSSLNC